MKLKKSDIELSPCGEVYMDTRVKSFGLHVMKILQDMYEAYNTKELLLWCILPGKRGAVGKKCSNDTKKCLLNVQCSFSFTTETHSLLGTILGVCIVFHTAGNFEQCRNKLVQCVKNDFSTCQGL